MYCHNCDEVGHFEMVIDPYVAVVMKKKMMIRLCDACLKRRIEQAKQAPSTSQT